MKKDTGEGDPSLFFGGFYNGRHTNWVPLGVGVAVYSTIAEATRVRDAYPTLGKCTIIKYEGPEQ